MAALEEAVDEIAAAGSIMELVVDDILGCKLRLLFDICVERFPNIILSGE